MQDKNKSLLSLFIPPKDNLRGVFGLLSGYSATQDFMEIALDNFSTKSSLERSGRGSLSMVLFLDKRKLPLKVAGLHHALFLNSKPGFSLMHAKVGFLAFAKDEHNPVEVIRIFISTGNWTRSGMIENLDHVWKLDINVKDTVREDLVEGRKVIDFFLSLTKFYPVIDEAKRKMLELSKLLPGALSKVEIEGSRFFSTFEGDSVLDGISRRFNSAGKSGYNAVFCGSGFFEEVENNEKLKVFDEIETKLMSGKAFTKVPDRVAIINPIDKWKFKDLVSRAKNNWIICPFEDYEMKGNQKRTFLHAKFIFGGYLHNSNYTRGSLYLGSGNLTKKGFLLGINNPEGNIEAGVVIDASGEARSLTRNLCVGLKPYKLDDLEKAEITSSMEEIGDEIITACPLRAIVDFDIETGIGKLEWNEDSKDCFYYGKSQSDIKPIHKDDKIIEIPLSCKLEGSLIVFVKGEKRSYSVPIITDDGEFCLIPPEKIDVTSALDLLLEYPEAQTSQDVDEDGEVIRKEVVYVQPPHVSSKSSTRSLSMAMELVECIARKNHSTPAELLMGWFSKLEFTLVKCLNGNEKEDFKKLGINFFSVLENEHFAPNWDEIEDHQIIKAKYDDVLLKICQSWEIADHPPMGVLPNV